LLTENNGLVGFKMNWTLLEFGKRSGQVHERQAQVAEAEENLRHVQNRVRVEIEKEVSKVRRAETGLERRAKVWLREPRCAASQPIRWKRTP